MSEAEITVVREFVAVDADAEWIDAAGQTEDEEMHARRAELMAEDAVVTFPSPDGGFVGAMAGPFQGADGMRTGWREWLTAWRRFDIRVDSVLDAGDGRVLLLGLAKAETHSGLPLETGVAAVYTLRDGRIVKLEHFLDQDQARRTAGLA